MNFYGCVGEKDVLIGGANGVARNSFLLGSCGNFSYYLGNGDNDYATIINFDPTKDQIFYDPGYSYSIVFNNGISYLYVTEGPGTYGPQITSLDLVAKIYSNSTLLIEQYPITNYFLAADCSIG
jgi:hypothetical protein